VSQPNPWVLGTHKPKPASPAPVVQESFRGVAAPGVQSATLDAYAMQDTHTQCTRLGHPSPFLDLAPCAQRAMHQGPCTHQHAPGKHAGRGIHSMHTDSCTRQEHAQRNMQTQSCTQQKHLYQQRTVLLSNTAEISCEGTRRHHCSAARPSCISANGLARRTTFTPILAPPAAAVAPGAAPAETPASPRALKLPAAGPLLPP
jgi:hypothetical protein